MAHKLAPAHRLAMAHKLATALLLTAVATSTGCFGGLIANIAHVIHGPERAKVQFDKLEGKRVAVLCVSATDAYGGGSFPMQLGKAVHLQLRANVPDIEMVSQDDLADWTDRHDWTQSDYLEIGRGVKADYVVVIELNTSVRLKEGPQLFKGHADFTTSVYETAKNQQVFRKRYEDYSWPTQPRYGDDERTFERAFLGRLAGTIARPFYAYELLADVASDSSDY